MNRQIVVVGILALLLFSSFAVGLGSASVKGNTMKISNGGVKGYTTHGIIRINSNADFDSSHGVVGGSGTSDDPYIISGWDIDAHGSGAAIYIGNTTVYFVVENCYLHNIYSNSVQWPDTYSGGAVTLYKVQNATIQHNLISGNDGMGILIAGYYNFKSSHINVRNNTISNNSWDGIFMWVNSSKNIINGNNITNNNGYGIYLGHSSSNTIYNNLISNNAYGFYIYSGSYNLIYNNSFYYNHGSGDVYDSSHIQAYDGGSNNHWNTTTGIGNYWHEWANNNNTNDLNHDGIVDWPYKIDGSAGAKDYYPLKDTSLSNVLSHPMNLTARAGDGYVNLTWDPPVYGKNTVTQYNIYRNGVLIKIKTVSSNQLWFNDTNVQNGQTYTYYVTAVNSVGRSEPSNKVQATPSGAVPEFSTGTWLLIVILISLLGVVRFRKIS